MDFLVILLAVVGVAAVLYRAGRSALWSLWRGVDAYLKGEVAEQHARRGDLTGMADAKKRHALARQRRWIAAGRLGVWVALLIVPVFTSWTAALYASYSVLWLLPGGRTRA